MRLTEQQILQITNLLQNRPVLKAYVFGSYARNDAEMDSDIDLLVELGNEADLFAFVKMKIDLQEMLNHEVDLVSERGLSPHIRPFIEKDKILIYERSAK